MANEPKTIRVPNDSELAHALEDVDHTPVLLEKDGVVFRVSRADGAAQDISASCAGITAASGSWKDMDTEAFKTYITSRRRLSTRSSVRL